MGIDKSQLKIAPARRMTDSDTIISGTSMTYSQFKSLTGREYDAFNDLDRKTVINMAGAGKITPGKYDTNRMSESERLMMTGYQAGAAMPETEGPRQAALYRSGEDLRKLEAQVAAGRNRTPEERRAAGKASYQAYLQTPEGKDLYKKLQSEMGAPVKQSTLGSVTTPAPITNQMIKSTKPTASLSSRVQLTPGSKKSIDDQLKRLRGL
jgi:hypothetical protein